MVIVRRTMYLFTAYYIKHVMSWIGFVSVELLYIQQLACLIVNMSL